MSEKLRGIGLRTLAANAGGTMGRQLLVTLIVLATVVVIARVYGPEANGRYTIALLLPSMLATFLNFGIGSANVYYLGSGKHDARSVFRTSLKIVIWLSLAGLSVGAAIILTSSGTLFPGVPQPMLWIALLSFPIVLGQGVITSVFQGLQRFGYYNVGLLAQPSITFVLVVGVSIVGVDNLVWLIAGNLVGHIGALVITGWMLRSCIGRDGPTNPYAVKTALAYGYKAHFGNILGFINYKADIFLVNLMISPAAAGMYVIAVTISERLWLLSQAISTVALPRLSELSTNEPVRRVLTPLLARFVLSITAAGAVMLGLLAFPLVRVLFGELFESASLPLVVLLPGVVAGSAARILANDIAARGRPELNMYTVAVIVAVNILGNILLIPKYGLVGAAAATTVANIVNLALRLFVYRKLTGISSLEVLLLQRKDILALKKYAEERT